MAFRERPALVIGGGALLVAVLVFAIALAVRGPAATATPSATPTPTPFPSLAPGVWRIGGIVVDEAGQPLQGVCVGIGPAICTDVNPRTEADGTWYIDLPKASVDYDFHFTKVGYKQFDAQLRPVASQNFRVTLSR